MDINAYRAISTPNAHRPWTALLAKKKMLAPIIIELLIAPILNIELPALQNSGRSFFISQNANASP